MVAARVLKRSRSVKSVGTGSDFASATGGAAVADVFSADVSSGVDFEFGTSASSPAAGRRTAVATSVERSPSPAVGPAVEEVSCVVPEPAPTRVVAPSPDDATSDEAEVMAGGFFAGCGFDWLVTCAAITSAKASPVGPPLRSLSSSSRGSRDDAVGAVGPPGSPGPPGPLPISGMKNLLIGFAVLSCADMRASHRPCWCWCWC